MFKSKKLQKLEEYFSSIEINSNSLIEILGGGKFIKCSKTIESWKIRSYFIYSDQSLIYFDENNNPKYVININHILFKQGNKNFIERSGYNINYNNINYNPFPLQIILKSDTREYLNVVFDNLDEVKKFCILVLYGSSINNIMEFVQEQNWIDVISAVEEYQNNLQEFQRGYFPPMNSNTRSELHHELSLLQSANQIVLVKLSLLTAVLRKGGITFEDPMNLRSETYDIARCHLCRQYYDKKLAYLQSRISICNEKLELLLKDTPINDEIQSQQNNQDNLIDEDCDYQDILAKLSIDLPTSQQNSTNLLSSSSSLISNVIPIPTSSPEITSSQQQQQQQQQQNQETQSSLIIKPPQPPPPPPRSNTIQSQVLLSPINEKIEEDENEEILNNLKNNKNENLRTISQRRASLSTHSPQKQLKLTNWRRDIHLHLEKCYLEMKKIIPRDILTLSNTVIEINELERILITIYGYSSLLANRIIQKKCLWLISMSIIDVLKMSDDELFNNYSPKKQNLDLIELSAVYYILDPLIDEDYTNQQNSEYSYKIEQLKEMVKLMNEMSERRLEMIHKVRKKLKHLLNEQNSNEIEYHYRRHSSYSVNLSSKTQDRISKEFHYEEQQISLKNHKKSLKYEEI